MRLKNIFQDVSGSLVLGGNVGLGVSHLAANSDLKYAAAVAAGGIIAGIGKIFNCRFPAYAAAAIAGAAMAPTVMPIYEDQSKGEEIRHTIEQAVASVTPIHPSVSVSPFTQKPLILDR